MHPDRVTCLNRLPVTCATVTRRRPDRPFRKRPECWRPAALPAALRPAPQPNPIGRPRDVMHRHVTRNLFHADLRRFTGAIFRFFDETLPRDCERIAEYVTDSFRIIIYDGYRMVGQTPAQIRPCNGERIRPRSFAGLPPAVAVRTPKRPLSGPKGDSFSGFPGPGGGSPSGKISVG